MATINKKPSAASWAGRMGKRAADEQVFYVMRHWAFDSDKPRDVMSLPAGEWLWESSFAGAYHELPFNFYGVERDADVWARMRRSAKVLGKLRPYQKFEVCKAPTDVVDVLSTTSRKFDMIYLDWMGTWSHEKKSQIETILERRLINRNGLLRFTISLTRGQTGVWEPECSRYMGDLYGFQDMRGGGGKLQEWKIYGVPGLVMDMARRFYRNTVVISNLAYVSREDPKKPGVPELSVLLRLR